MGWIDNFYGPTGVCAGAGIGVIRTLHCDRTTNANIVPVDMVVNGLICSAFDIHKQFQQSLTDGDKYRIAIYNYASQKRNPIDWGTYMEHVCCNGIKYPTTKAIWYYSLTLNRNSFINMLYVVFLHLLPAIVIDTFLFCIGKKPKLFNLYRKIQKFSSVISYFCLRHWNFDDTNTERLYRSLSVRDQQQFPFDIEALNWPEYFVEYIKGMRLFLVKDPIDTLPEAMVRWKRLYLAHQFIKLFLVLMLLRILTWIFFH